MVKTVYGTAPGQPITNQQLAQGMTNQYPVGMQGGPGIGYDPNSQQYDPLAEALSMQAPHPVHSIGQGLVDAGSQIASAYLEKKAFDKRAAVNQQNAKYANDAYDMASNPNLTLAQAMNKVQQSTPEGFQDRPLNAQERAYYANQYLGGKNATLADQYHQQINQAAQQAQAPPMEHVVLKPGEGDYSRNPTTGIVNSTPTATQPMTPPDILRPGVLAAEIARTQAGKTSWRPATPAENQAHGLPPTARGAQVSSEGEFKGPEKQPGQFGPVYTPYGQPLGTADYTDPEIAGKLKARELLTSEPKVISPTELDKLETYGNTVQGLSKALGAFQDDYAGIQHTQGKVGLAVREMFGATPTGAWWSAYHQQILPTLKNTVGRSHALLERLDETTPQPSDAPSVVREKLASQIEIAREQGNQAGQTYSAGGYNRGQIETSLGFPLKSEATIPNAPSPIPEQAITALRENPSLAAQFDGKYGSGASQAYLRKK